MINIFKTLDDGTIINADTGEIARLEHTYLLPNEIVQVVDICKMAKAKGVSPHVAKKMPDPNLIKWQKGMQYTKVFSHAMAVIGRELTPIECKFLLLLMGYIRYDSGMLATLKGNPLINVDIEKIVGMSERTVRDVMDGLVKQRILAKNRVGISNQYFANPFIFMRGNYINKTLRAMFKSYQVKSISTTEGKSTEKTPSGP